ncbi:hypothetical protein GCM10023221_15390 [Luteimicrobium xylanilyticum]|uniref:Uncharacterized protein n=1 Tax=Luteimicrobium xylanilyticum TaxID=1133546 RepID=A0A5P9QF98_9MICO|nr:hypothetical protein [Luteimicrobium xylanilyticum]QFV00135.1 hypothetical protein KDY119_03670 [Luteimicrobium xylanilyticum]
MLEQLGPAVDAQVEYLREQARASYRTHGAQQGSRWHRLSHRLHLDHRAAA